MQIVRLSATQRTLSADAVRAETEAARLRADAVRLRGQIDPRELALVSADAREANAIIDRRTFSWTALFVQFEEALPPDVRITAVQPRREQDGSFSVNIGVEARRVEDVEAFIEALEARTPFRDVLPVEEQTERRRAHRGDPRRPLRAGAARPCGGDGRARHCRRKAGGAMSAPNATLARRVIAENRKPLIVLGAGLVLNVLIYAFGVYPLSQRVANVTERNQTAARALTAARARERPGGGRAHRQGPRGVRARHLLHLGPAAGPRRGTPAHAPAPGAAGAHA